MAKLESGDWAFLPEHLLDSILHRLVSPSDYVRFSAVCKRWLSVASDNIDKWRLPRMMLLIPTNDGSAESRSLYGIAEGKDYGLRLPVPYSGRCCGSSYGWLITTELSLALTLINPFSGDIIHLPPIFDPIERYGKKELVNHDSIVQKAILSADPYLHPDDYEVAAIVDGHSELAFLKSGDKSWTFLHDVGTATSLGMVDVIYYKKQLHFVNLDIQVMSIVNGSEDRKSFVANACVVAEGPSRHRTFEQTYIVESSTGDLLLVERHLVPLYNTMEDEEMEQGANEDGMDSRLVTAEFKVFKLPLRQSGTGPHWVEITSLGDDALFLGDNHSVSVLASDFPGCRPNSIYFTDDLITFGHPDDFGSCDMGLFSLEDGKITTHCTLHPSQRLLPPSVWIEPSFRGNWLKLPSF